ncbi:MAG: 1-deoxy-D-xylulose-5-phosphate synthase, partial [Ruminococcaceae bacterium]|nr:1-deoxy-D-xylulose-5-phosphate synthase [Oscillospiraceae bacterium]
ARLSGKEQHTVAVIGDGALTGGEAYEGLNNAGRSKERLCVILNDNEVSISKNVGAISKHLANIRTKPHYFRAKDRIEGLFDRLGAVGRPFKKLIVSVKKMVKDSLYDSNLFENFGFVYLGPVDGHDCNSLIDVFQRAKSLNRPVLIHMHTTKGKGYSFAEENPGAYHGAPSFDAEKGGLDIISEDCFSCVFGKELARLATEDPAICAVTAAMKYGTGLQYFRDGIRDRLFDVGIAEQHAVTFSAGLAAQGMKPVFAVYSTFLQRAYDQVLEDCAIENNKVVLAVDRAGIVGEDGETHQGIFDVSFLSAIPGITIFSPSSYQELKDDLFTALYRTDGLVAIRYPRGKEPAELAVFDAAFAPFRVIGEEAPSVLLVTYGRITAQAILAVEALKSHGVRAAVLQLNQIHPIPDEAILEALKAGKVFFFEEGIAKGSVAEHFGGRLLQAGFSGTYRFRAIDNQFVPHAPAKNALHHLGLDAEGMISFVNQFI